MSSDEIDNKPETKQRKKITDKQKASRIENLKKGRETRMKKIKEKKESKENEYDIDSGSESSDSEVDMDSFILSKKTKDNSKSSKSLKSKSKKKDYSETDELRNEIKELRGVMYEIVKKKAKKKPRKEGGTKIVLLPNQNQPKQEKLSNSEYNATVNQLMAAFGRK